MSRYTDAASALSRASQIEDRGDMALANRLNVHRGVVDHLISHFTADNDPKAYSDAFDKLAEWTDHSLDLYRVELQRVLYPVFMHCYLQLVSLDATATASMMLNRYRRRLLDSSGRLSRGRAHELHELQSVATKTHLESNRMAKKLLAPGAKSVVSLSTYSHDLLMHFLHSAPAMMPINLIVSQRLGFETVEGRPTGGVDGEKDAGDEDGETGGGGDVEAAATNNTAVELGLLMGNLEDKYVKQMQQKDRPATGAAATAAPADGADGIDKMDEDGAGAVKKPPSRKRPAAAAEEDSAALAALQQWDPSGPRVDPKYYSSGTQAGQGLIRSCNRGRRYRISSTTAVGPKRAQSCSEEEVGTALAALQQWDPSRPKVDLEPFVPTLPEDLAEQWLRDIEARVHVDNTPQHAPSCCLFTFVNTKHTLTCSAFSRDASKVAAGFADSTVRLYDVKQLSKRSASSATAASSEKKQAPSAASPSPTQPPPDTDADPDTDDIPGMQYMYGHSAAVHAVDFSPDMRLVMSASSDGTARLWSVELAVALAAYKGHRLPVWDISSCPLGYMFATASADRTARVWSTDSVKPLRILAGHQSDVDVVRWHPNCHYVATASSDRTVRLWDVQGGNCVRHLSGGPAAFTSLAMSPDGQQVAAGCEDGSIMVWDLGTAKRLATLSGQHIGPVWSLQYSGGRGALLVSGGDDATVGLWSSDKATPLETDSNAATANAGDESANKEAASNPWGGYAHMQTIRAKSSPVISLSFTSRNLILGAGPFNPKHKATPVTGTQS
eukprot:gene15377-21462_t